MILVTRLNGKEFVLNGELIETIEATPDTVITLTNGNKYLVAETPAAVVERITAYRRTCHPLFRQVPSPQGELNHNCCKVGEQA